jgi:hypothetical protein
MIHSFAPDTHHCSGPDEAQVARAKALTDDLLIVVRQEHAKVKVIVQQQQMELHHAQAQFAAYSVLGVCIIHSFRLALKSPFKSTTRSTRFLGLRLCLR